MPAIIEDGFLVPLEGVVVGLSINFGKGVELEGFDGVTRPETSGLVMTGF